MFDDVVSTLQGLDVNGDAIREIVGILEESQQDLHGGHPGTLGAAHLGGSDKAALLGHHTSIAHRHVVEAMEQMVAGLKGYQANVEKFHRDVDLTDGDAGHTQHRIAGRVETVPSVPDSLGCSAAPDLHDNPCNLPTGGDA